MASGLTAWLRSVWRMMVSPRRKIATRDIQPREYRRTLNILCRNFLRRNDGDIDAVSMAEVPIVEMMMRKTSWLFAIRKFSDRDGAGARDFFCSAYLGNKLTGLWACDLAKHFR